MAPVRAAAFCLGWHTNEKKIGRRLFLIRVCLSRLIQSKSRIWCFKFEFREKSVFEAKVWQETNQPTWLADVGVKTASWISVSGFFLFRRTHVGNIDSMPTAPAAEVKQHNNVYSWSKPTKKATRLKTDDFVERRIGLFVSVGTGYTVYFFPLHYRSKFPAKNLSSETRRQRQLSSSSSSTSSEATVGNF